MVFALMSGKKIKDYKAVFKAVIEMLPVQPAVKGIVIDYEMAVWSARMQRSVYRQLQSRIFTLWEEYKSGERTSKQLLRACARLYGPRDI